METMNRKKLDKLLKSRLSTKRCRKCGSAACEVVFDFAWYGRDGAKVRCKHCGYETGLQDIHAHVQDEKRFATPITFNSLVKAVFNAVNDWNCFGGAAQ